MTLPGLNRQASPLSAAVWARIDAQLVAAASALLTGRRFLHLDGPYGPGLTSLEIGHDDFCREAGSDEAAAIGSRAIAVPMLRRAFRLSLRRLAGDAEGQPLSMAPVADAAEALARREEDIVYRGQATFGLPGLLTVPGAHLVKGPSWDKPEQALQAVLEAVTLLDNSRCRGPYALALSPQLYNGLFRRTHDGDMLQLEHLGRLCEAGVYKADIDGGVLVDPRVGRLVVGQDMMAGYAAQDGVHCQLFVSESLALVIEDPKAICRLTPEG